VGQFEVSSIGEATAMSENIASGTDASIFMAQQMLEKAEWAVSAFSSFGRAEVMKIAEAAACAAEARADELAEWAVRETGFGVTQHKAEKNRLCSRGILEYYRNENLTDFRIDEARKIVEIPKPAGVIFALVPSTNPVSTVFYKTMLAILSRNAVVISPHPAARECCVEAAREMARAVEAAGAPDGIVQVVEHPDLPLIDAIMKSPKVNVILATGGTPMVRAAYSSGNPALGVGPGNGPAYVDATADVAMAAKQITDSKAYDNSVLCTNESAVIAHTDISAQLIKEFEKQGCYFCSETERTQIEDALFPAGKFNVGMLGKDAVWIAKQCGIRVPSKTRVLLVPLERIGDDYMLSREKLCPVLGYYEVAGINAALIAARAMVRHSGGGHSAAVHATDAATILRFGSELNVLRIAVNAPCSTGSAGFDTHLAPTMTIGTGFYGRSSISENVGPGHLVQWSRVASNKDASVAFTSFSNLDLPHHSIQPQDIPDTRYQGWKGSQPGGMPLPNGAQARPPLPGPSYAGTGAASDGQENAMRDEIRRIIAEELRAFAQDQAAQR